MQAVDVLMLGAFAVVMTGLLLLILSAIDFAIAMRKEDREYEELRKQRGW